jgi:DNA-binding transcriptional LysR family regulator
MVMAEPDWDLYRSFLAVLRLHSLSAAARTLGLTQPTVGRHIAALEVALGKVALFTRSPAGLVATETALDLAPHAEAMAAAAAAFTRAASGEAEEARGTVRITASEMVGGAVLPEILADLQVSHPGITVELALSNRTEDLLRRDADIAVRMVRPQQLALLAQYLGRIGLGLFAHHRYLERRRAPKSVAELAEHTIIGFDRDAAAARSLAGSALAVTRDQFAFRCDSDLAQWAAVRAGLGIGVAQLGLARREPELVQLLPRAVRFHLDVWLAMHEDLRASRRMRLVFDHLAHALRNYVATCQATSTTLTG